LRAFHVFSFIPKSMNSFSRLFTSSTVWHFTCRIFFVSASGYLPSVLRRPVPQIETTHITLSAFTKESTVAKRNRLSIPYPTSSIFDDTAIGAIPGTAPPLRRMCPRRSLIRAKLVFIFRDTLSVVSALSCRDEQG
jgi:hypothetical protein